MMDRTIRDIRNGCSTGISPVAMDEQDSAAIEMTL
jgi:hypothetical protein